MAPLVKDVVHTVLRRCSFTILGTECKPSVPGTRLVIYKCLAFINRHISTQPKSSLPKHLYVVQMCSSVWPTKPFIHSVTKISKWGSYAVSRNQKRVDFQMGLENSNEYNCQVPPPPFKVPPNRGGCHTHAG